MNSLQNLTRLHALPLQGFSCYTVKPSSCSVNSLVKMNFAGSQRNMAMKAISGSTSSAEKSGPETEDEKSEIYSHNMTEAMGAVLTYRHELGMNYDFVLPDLIVGSCLQTPKDVDKLRGIGVKTIFCVQQDSDLEYPTITVIEICRTRSYIIYFVFDRESVWMRYFGVDITAIRDYADACGDIQHLRVEIRDFDAFDLRLRLPAVVSKLYKAIYRNGGVTYIHCTAGLGRAPAVALAYMFWVQGYELNQAQRFLLSKRPCFPKLDAIKSTTADILTGLKKKPVTLSWKDSNCTSVEISGLDIGWGQRIPLNLDEGKGLWILKRELPEGHYEYKYIVDGEWACNEDELVTTPNKDGHVNNYIQVVADDPSSAAAVLRAKLSGENPQLTKEQRQKIRRFLEAYPDEE